MLRRLAPWARGVAVLACLAVVATPGAGAEAADHALAAGSVSAVFASKAPSAAGTQFFYAQASQAGAASGGWGYFDVARPSASVVLGTHSLAELAVSSADGKQIVEVGWTVDPQFGDTQPRLFVFHWVDGKPACYNGCGFVPVAGSAGGGPVTRPLTVGSVAHLAIWHAANGWQISADGVGSLGYFPDSLWGGRFVQAGNVQWFGEVAATSATPCIDMGYGQFASSIFAARIFNVGRFGAATTDIVTQQSHPNYYTAKKVSATELRYGGPGAC